MRQDARAARGQNGQLFSLVLGEKVRRVAPGKSPDRLICPDRRGQGCRNGRTVFLQRRHRLSEHSTPREIYNAAPRAPAVRGLPYQSAAARRKRQCGRAEPPACSGPLCFSVLSGRGKAPSDLGLAFRAKLSGVVRVRVPIEFLAGPYLHDQARGISGYFPRPPFPYSMQGIHALHAEAAQAPCLCRARRSQSLKLSRSAAL